MARRASSNSKIVLDPIFAIPSGAEDEFTYSDESTAISGATDEQSEGEFYTDTDAIVSVDNDATEGMNLSAPDSIVIVSQTLRRAPGGQQVIDLIIEVEDIPGATNYEVAKVVV